VIGRDQRPGKRGQPGSGVPDARHLAKATVAIHAIIKK
jgi:hypothetical protein